MFSAKLADNGFEALPVGAGEYPEPFRSRWIDEPWGSDCQAQIEIRMRKNCTVCGQQLEIWERVWGRFDHARCRSNIQGRHRLTNNLNLSPPVQTELEQRGVSGEFLPATTKLFSQNENPGL
jgi:hypothetical protein